MITRTRYNVALHNIALLVYRQHCSVIATDRRLRKEVEIYVGFILYLYVHLWRTFYT